MTLRRSLSGKDPTLLFRGGASVNILIHCLFIAKIVRCDPCAYVSRNHPFSRKRLLLRLETAIVGILEAPAGAFGAAMSSDAAGLSIGRRVQAWD